ncbi:MAG: hypothetical protein LBM61_02090, partial [Prevotellaceae bacterium]|nr:hypothetical protein [Prevotellaceae bacterium]
TGDTPHTKCPRQPTTRALNGSKGQRKENKIRTLHRQRKEKTISLLLESYGAMTGAYRLLFM